METPDHIFSVSDLTGLAKDLLEDNFPSLWLEGEISNLATPSSGHSYFSLKDDNAQVRCAFFRHQQRQSPNPPENGMQALVKARVSLYEARGDFQLIIDYLEEAGDGALHRAFEALKKRLAKAGLFAEKHKQAIPALPQRIGIITSPTGAAIRDILSTLKRRFAAIPIIIYPTAVQGETAAANIVSAIQLAEQRKECDVLILARGGGSLEDLWPFNEEIVAKTIFAANIPIISAVGHEVDFTIADFVADVRAATPTGAAELVSPEQQHWKNQLNQLNKRLYNSLQSYLKQAQNNLSQLKKQLKHPGQRLREKQQQLDYLEQQLCAAWQHNTQQKKQHWTQLQHQLQQQSPQQTIKRLNLQQDYLQQRLQQSMQHALQKMQDRLQAKAAALDTISPLATLKRGYAIVSHSSDKKSIVRSLDELAIGDKISARLPDGLFDCTVDKLRVLK